MKLIATLGCAATIVTVSCGSSGPVPNDLIGERLDVAEAELSQAGISYTEVGGGTFGIVVKSDWVVCQTKPEAGQPVNGSVQLIVDHFGCTTSTPGSPTP